MIEVKIKEQIINVYEASKDLDVSNLIDEIAKDLISWRFKWDYDEIGNRTAHYFANYPISFDIETSSFYNDEQGKFLSISDYNKRLDKIYADAYKINFKKIKDKEKSENKARIAQKRESEKYSKCACMYIWTMAFGASDKNLVIIGRTWDEWAEFLMTLKSAFELNEQKEFLIQVHNLHYEFGWIKRNFTWNQKNNGTFLSDKVVYKAQTEGLYYEDPDMPRGLGIMEFAGFTFKDTLILSGCKEENLPKLMPKYGNKSKKLVGQLDYDKVRHSGTKLSNDELAYCINDCLLLNWYIREKMEEDENLDSKGRPNLLNVAMTKTGEVRRVCKDKLFYKDGRKSKTDFRKKEYEDFLKKIKIDFQTYKQIRRAFQGGFTHANKNNAMKVLENEIVSYDIKSSYPAQMVMCSEYPMGPYELVEVKTKEQFNTYIENYSCLFDVHLKDVRPRFEDGVDYDKIDNIISIYKIEEYGNLFPNCEPIYPSKDENYYSNNGRLRYAKDIYLSINHLDWEIITMFYDFDRDNVDVDNFRVAKKGYLPKPLIEYVLELFRQKEISPSKFLRTFNKTRLNSLFGMIATDILKESFYLDKNNTLRKRHENMTDDEECVSLEKELEEKSLFLAYQWSHILTSAARLALMRCIEASKYWHSYSDTDSEKVRINKDTIEFINNYNKEVDYKMNLCFSHYKMPKDSHIIPETGACLGHWECENELDEKGNPIPYKRFTTCGAKRYLYEDNEGIHLTCAGLPKESIIYLIKKYGDDLFDVFSKGEIVVDKNATVEVEEKDDDGTIHKYTKRISKLAATYIDYSIKGEVVDYLGNKSTFAEMSCVHLEPVDFDMTLCEDYEYLSSIGEMEQGI